TLIPHITFQFKPVSRFHIRLDSNAVLRFLKPYPRSPYYDSTQLAGPQAAVLRSHNNQVSSFRTI
ncbi:6495_t:CDS:1, partial [Gigaspora rosea]